MANFNKEELLGKSDIEIVAIARELELKVDPKESKENLIYRILDEQAIRGSVESPSTSKRRSRIKSAKKNQNENKNKSVQEINEKQNDAQKNVESASVKEPKKRVIKSKSPKLEEETKEDAVVEEKSPAPKKRGRKKKAEESSEAEAQNNASEVKMASDKSEIVEASVKKALKRKSNPDRQVDDIPDFIIIQDVPTEESMVQEQPKIDDNTDKPMVTDESKPPFMSAKIPDYWPKGNETSRLESIPEVQKDDEYKFDDILKGNGVLDITDNCGFLRSSDYNYLTSPDDIFVPMALVKNYGLKQGDVVEGNIRVPGKSEKYFTLVNVKLINGCDPRLVRDRVPFEHLTPLFPDEKFRLCSGQGDNMSVRIVDLFTPIGKGQRALIVAQPKTGKTILMKDIANAIAANHPEAYLMMLLIDERPEEVTDMARTVKAEVIASTFDEPAAHHVKIAGIVLDKAKRMVECGHDVVIFLDSITRLARAYNTVAPASGKVLTGGVDANALQKPKRFFGAARNIEGGGSLTIIATALIDTGSKMDEVIFEEFKGTGNMELQLDRTLSNKRIFPAVNCVMSSTRRDDLLHDKTTLDRMWILRKHISDMNAIEAMTLLQDRMLRTDSNEEFLLSMNS